jgi:hypothetical protein
VMSLAKYKLAWIWKVFGKNRAQCYDF